MRIGGLQGDAERAALPAAFTPKSTSFRCRLDRLGDPQAVSGEFPDIGDVDSSRALLEQFVLALAEVVKEAFAVRWTGLPQASFPLERKRGFFFL